MPLVRLPNASFIAGAGHDLPILPFLAPRAFGEAPAPTDRKSGAILVNGIHQLETKRPGGGAGLKRAPLETTGRCSLRRPPSVSRLYADIFAIARCQTRRYASTAPSAHRPPIDKPTADAMASERSKALAVETERLQSYLSRYAQLNEEQLMQRGHYRSLRRRIANLVHWHRQELQVAALPDNRDWLIQAFAALDRSAYVQVKQITRTIRIVHQPECALSCSALLEGFEEEGSSRLWKNWANNELHFRESMWRPLLLYLLDCKPSRALTFMQILVEDSHLRKSLDPAMLADALGHLARLHLKGQYDTDPDWNQDLVKNEQEFAPGFYQIYLRMFTERTYCLSQDLIYTLSQFMDTQDFKRIFDLFIEEKTRFGFNTLLHYANVFARAGEVDYALRCLDKLHECWGGQGVWDEVVDRERLRMTCALILRKSANQKSGYRATPLLVESFVRMGVKMNLALYNVVIHNAMEAGDFTTAFKLYNSLEEHNLEPDTFTLGILLHGCIQQDNPGMFSAFARHCRDVAKETRHVWLASEYLYYIFVRHEDTADVEVFTTTLWHAYLELFDASALEPLVSLRRHHLRNRIASSVLGPGTTLMEPSPMGLYILLQVEIKYAMSFGDGPVQTLYDQFKVLVLTGKHPVLTDLAKHPIIWNAFLFAFCRKEQFAAASQVIKDMTENSPQPNIYTWNIFMKGFFRTGQVQAAERVFEIMRSRGIDPDQYTHGVMLHGYAKAQLIDRIGETMQHVDADHEMDVKLLQALSRVVDREKMMRVLEESRAAKEARIQRQAEMAAAERAKKWAKPEYIDPDDEVAELRKQEGVALTEAEKEIMELEEQAQKLEGQFLVPPPPAAPLEKATKRLRAATKRRKEMGGASGASEASEASD